MPWRSSTGAVGSDGFVPVEMAQTGPGEFTLRADLVYEERPDNPYLRAGQIGRLHVVPAGFRTDLASVPFPLWALIGPFGRQTRAAILHDHACRALGRPVRTPARYREREVVDRRFRDALLDSGTPPLRAYLMWAGVSVARIVEHRPVPVAVALVAQLAVGLVLLVGALVGLDGGLRPVAAVAPLVLAGLWGRAWSAVALVQYAGTLVLPAIVVNWVTAAALTLAGAAWGGRPGDIRPTRVGG